MKKLIVMMLALVVAFSFSSSLLQPQKRCLRI